MLSTAGFRNDTCELTANAEFGRYVRASRDIRAGELLLVERPVVVGPTWGAPRCCLNCYGDAAAVCGTCNIAPLCGKCTKSTAATDHGHNADECAWMLASQLPSSLRSDHFDLITPLRLARLASDGDRTDQFDAVWQLESHCDRRRDSSIWQLHAEKVVAPMLALCGHLLRPEADRRTEAFLQRCCGIMDVNAMEVRTECAERIPVRGLYASAALLSHSCANNTFITVDAERTLRVYASVEIGAGETVYNTYTAPLTGTAQRAEHLWHGKYFRCQCARCLDPTELGTHFSSVRCTECRVVLENSADADTADQQFLDNPSTRLLTFDAGAQVWRCAAGGHSCSAAAVQQRIDLARRIAERVCDDNITGMELLVERQTRLLNTNHYVVVESKQRLAAALRAICDDPDAMRRMRRSDLLRVLQLKVRMCSELLPLLRVLKPGISRMTAIALYELFTAQHRIADLKKGTPAMSPTEYLDTLGAAEQMAKECVAMLLYEPRSTPEGELAQAAMQHLKQLREIIACEQSNVSSR